MSRPALRPLPTHLSNLLTKGPQQGDNLSLWLDRFLPRDPTDFWSLKGEQRSEALKPFVKPWHSPSAAEVLARRQTWPQTGERGPVRVTMTLKLSGRLLLGAGSGSATELNLSLDPLHGAPRLPGSALKGLARAVAESEDSGWDSEALCYVFGQGPTDPGGALVGAVEFLDALPEGGRFSLVMDVLTPHMGPWYRGEVDAPVEWLSPVPVSFLAVSQASFVFDLLVWPTPKFPWAMLAARAQRALKTGLMNLGLGGKTAVGYGYFEEA